MNFQIIHKTRYIYHEPVSLCYNMTRLLPRELPYQEVEKSSLTIVPPAIDSREHLDYFGNRVVYFSIQQPHDVLTVTAASHVGLRSEARSTDFSGDLLWRQARGRLLESRDPEAIEAFQFILASPLVAPSTELAGYAATSFPENGSLLEGVADLMHRIHGDFEYVPGFTTITTPLDELFRHRRGVCQDFAHFAIGCLRSIGLAARYTSGYIETLPPEDQPHLEGADASHAWFSVFVPGKGWVDFDPTNDKLPCDQHITVAWGRDYADVTPLKGIVFSSGSHELSVTVDVERIAD
jgi:transglutaminase-like putative cysteine protease